MVAPLPQADTGACPYIGCGLVSYMMERKSVLDNPWYREIGMIRKGGFFLCHGGAATHVLVIANKRKKRTVSMSPNNPVPQKVSTGGARWLLIALAIFLMMVAVQFWNSGEQNLHDTKAQPRPIVPRGDLAADEQSTVQLFQKCAPSVVYITTLTVRRDVFSLNLLEIPQGTGSGFIWNDQGHVVTNFHVIQKADTARVTLADHSTWEARLVGVAPDKDLAVLKINAPISRLYPIQVGTSQDLAVGQKVFAIGNPFGFDQTLTTGVISGLGREIQSVTRRPIRGVIQTDAAINPGTSGGPLLDSAGLLIGVNAAIYSPSGVYAGIGFAVPVDTVNRVVPQIIRHGKVIRPGLGITIAEEQVTKRFELQGVLVIDVLPNSAAAQAGMRPTRYGERGQVRLGDVIVAIDGKTVKTSNELFVLLEDYQVGDTITVTVQRDGQVKKLPVTLQEMQ